MRKRIRENRKAISNLNLMIQTIITHECPRCGSIDLVKNGHDYKGDQNVFGRSRAEQLDRVIVNELVVTLRFPLSEFSARAARREGGVQFANLVCQLREAGFTDRTCQITGTIGVVD